MGSRVQCGRRGRAADRQGRSRRSSATGRPDRAVATAVSCMGCHASGIIDARSELREATRELAERADRIARLPPTGPRAHALYAPGSRQTVLTAIAASRASPQSRRRARLTSRSPAGRHYECEVGLRTRGGGGVGVGRAGPSVERVVARRRVRAVRQDHRRASPQAARSRATVGGRVSPHSHRARRDRRAGTAPRRRPTAWLRPAARCGSIAIATRGSSSRPPPTSATAAARLSRTGRWPCRGRTSGRRRGAGPGAGPRLASRCDGRCLARCLEPR